MECRYIKDRLGKTIFLSLLVHLFILILFGILLQFEERPGHKSGKRLLVTLYVEPPGTVTKESPERKRVPFDVREATKKVGRTSRETARPKGEKIAGKKPSPMPGRKSAARSAPVRTPSPSRKTVGKGKKPSGKPERAASPAKRSASSGGVSPREAAEPSPSGGSGKKSDTLPESPAKSLSGRKMAKVKRYGEAPYGERSVEYTNYIEGIRNKIRKHWKYPEAAKALGLEGGLTVQFYVFEDGSLGEIKVTQSSGIPILDHGVVKAVKHAAPFDPLPRFLKKKQVAVNLRFEYDLNFVSLR